MLITFSFAISSGSDGKWYVSTSVKKIKTRSRLRFMCTLSGDRWILRITVWGNWVISQSQIYFIIFGLSKERPILGDHPKAHIHEIRWISCRFQVKSGGFCADFRWNPADFVQISREICQIPWNFRWNPVDFMQISREIRRISKDQLPRMVSPMFNNVATTRYLWAHQIH